MVKAISTARDVDFKHLGRLHEEGRLNKRVVTRKRSCMTTNRLHVANDRSCMADVMARVTKVAIPAITAFAILTLVENVPGADAGVASFMWCLAWCEAATCPTGGLSTPACIAACAALGISTGPGPL